MIDKQLRKNFLNRKGLSLLHSKTHKASGQGSVVLEFETNRSIKQYSALKQSLMFM